MVKRLLGFLAVLLLPGCMEWDYDLESEFDVYPVKGQGLFIINEGNYQYGNASLSFYDIASGTVENDVFIRANEQKLGDVAQSAVVHGGKLWIVVNNSHVVFAVDPVSYKEVGRITGFTSPRHIHFVSDEKAYVSQLWDNRIFIVNPLRYEITGWVQTGMNSGTASTEQMLGYGEDWVIVNCWSYQDKILKINRLSDEVVEELRIGVQPKSMVFDGNGKLWVLTDGGYEGSPAGHEKPRLVRVDPESFTVEKTFEFYGNAAPYDLAVNPLGDYIYFICGDVWRMPVEAEELPQEAFVQAGERLFYALGVCPFNGEVFVADAIDWQQKGMIYRYSESGELVDEFRAGVSPGDFCWF